MLLVDKLDELDVGTGDTVGFKFVPALSDKQAMRIIRQAFWDLGYRNDLRWKVVDGEHVVQLKKLWRK